MPSVSTQKRLDLPQGTNIYRPAVVQATLHWLEDLYSSFSRMGDGCRCFQCLFICSLCLAKLRQRPHRNHSCTSSLGVVVSSFYTIENLWRCLRRRLTSHEIHDKYLNCINECTGVTNICFVSRQEAELMARIGLCSVMR